MITTMHLLARVEIVMKLTRKCSFPRGTAFYWELFCSAAMVKFRYSKEQVLSELVVFYPDAFEIFQKSNYKRLLTLMSKEMIYETASNTNTRNSCDLFIFTLFLFRMFSLFHYEIMPSISESRDKFTSWRRIFEFINADYRIVFSAEKGVEQDKQSKRS